MRAKSKVLSDKPNFKKRLSECSEHVVSLFEALRDESLRACKVDDWGYTDKPDFRLSERYVFCELVPMKKPQSVRVILRVDQYPLTSNEFVLQKVKRDRPGIAWRKFEVIRKDQIPTAIRLIKQIHEIWHSYE